MTFKKYGVAEEESKKAKGKRLALSLFYFGTCERENFK
jgi:hypothetical protein